MSIAERLRAFIPTPVRRARRAIINGRIERREEAGRQERENTLDAIVPLRDLPTLLQRDTHITKLYASTRYGQFAFYTRDTVIGWSLAVGGQWEPLETDLLVGLVGPGDTVVDVGANLGWYSVQFARKTGPDGKVFSFEPDPDNFALLNENLALNDVDASAVTRRLALLDRKGSVAFELSSSNYGDHRVRFGPPPKGVPDLYAESTRQVISVEATTLDDALDEQGAGEKRIRLLKMDCQGSEAAIALGARRTLARTEYLATEFWPYGIRRSGHDPASYLAALSSSFESFTTLTESTTEITFRPISALESDAGMITGEDFRLYLLKGSPR